MGAVVIFPWAWFVVATLMLVLFVIPLVAKLIPPRPDVDKVGRHAAVGLGPYRDGEFVHFGLRGFHVDEGAREPWPHHSPDGTALCCDQAVVAWPYPCPWHPDGKPAGESATAFVETLRASFTEPIQ